MPSAEERHQMEARGFTWDPTEPWAGAYPRWTHFEKNISAIRQPYMTELQLELRRTTMFPSGVVLLQYQRARAR
jgi:hypothetical protein